MNIGSMINFYRKQQSMTQGELAQGICSQGEISLIEKGLRTPSVEMVTKISLRLGVPVDVFEKKIFYNHQEQYITSILDTLEIFVNNRQYEKMPLYLNEETAQKYCTNPLTKQCYLCYWGIYINYGENNPRKALETFRKALQETNVTAFSTILDFPKHKDSYTKTETLLISGAASCYFRLDKFMEADILFQVAIKNVPNIKLQLSTQILGTIYYNASKNLKAIGNFDQALTCARQGLQFENERKTNYRSAEILYEIGEILSLQRNHTAAEKAYIKSMYLSFATDGRYFLPLLLDALKQKTKLPLLQENIQMLEKIK